jgi:hypothetical protein
MCGRLEELTKREEEMKKRGAVSVDSAVFYTVSNKPNVSESLVLSDHQK